MNAGKVLVVDDDPSVRDMLAEYLTTHGYEVAQGPGVQPLELAALGGMAPCGCQPAADTVQQPAEGGGGKVVVHRSLLGACDPWRAMRQQWTAPVTARLQAGHAP